MRSFILAMLFLPFILWAGDRDVALVYLKELNKSSPHTRQGEMIDTALTYSDELSGLWHIKGRLSIDETDWDSALASYERALTEDDWEGGDFYAFLIDYMDLLTKMKHWDKILHSRSYLGPHWIDREPVLLASGWAHFYLNNEEAALGCASKGISLYPESYDFYLLHMAIRRDNTIERGFLYYWGEDVSVMESAAYRLFKLNRLTPALSLRLMNISASELSRSLSLMAKEGEADYQEALADFIIAGGTEDLDILNRFYGSASTENKRRIDKYVLAGNRTFYMDRDGDSYRELLLDDKLVLTIDRNWDGRKESVIPLDKSGLPREWIDFQDRGEERIIRFFEWPQVREILLKREGVQRKFAYPYPRFSLEERVSLPRVSDLFAFLNWCYSQRLSLAPELILDGIHRMEMAGEGLPNRIYYFHDNRLTALEEDEDRDGFYERQVVFKGDQIEAARRDLDQDGLFDLFEYYDRGKWSGFAVNLNHRSWADFYEDWSLITLKLWDYDDDQLINGYILESTGGTEKIIVPRRDDVIRVEDLLYWEKRFESQWFR